jgi:hypothetical protein
VVKTKTDINKYGFLQKVGVNIVDQRNEMQRGKIRCLSSNIYRSDQIDPFSREVKLSNHLPRFIRSIERKLVKK